MHGRCSPGERLNLMPSRVLSSRKIFTTTWPRPENVFESDTCEKYRESVRIYIESLGVALPPPPSPDCDSLFLLVFFAFIDNDLDVRAPSAARAARPFGRPIRKRPAPHHAPHVLVTNALLTVTCGHTERRVRRHGRKLDATVARMSAQATLSHTTTRPQHKTTAIRMLPIRRQRHIFKPNCPGVWNRSTSLRCSLMFTVEPLYEFNMIEMSYETNVLKHVINGDDDAQCVTST